MEILLIGFLNEDAEYFRGGALNTTWTKNLE